MSWRVLEGDSLAAMQCMRPRSVDLVIADPPWNAGKSYGGHDDELAPGPYAGWLQELLAACAAVTRGNVIVLPGRRHAGAVAALLPRAGLVPASVVAWRDTRPPPGVWGPGGSGWQPALVAAPPSPAGLPTVRPGGRLSVASDPGDRRAAARHPCPKPVALLHRLIAMLSPPGGTVLDPVAGSGTTLVAARDVGRAALGIELEPRFCSLARERLR